MARIETWLKTDLQQIVKVQELDGNLFSADNQANRIGVIVTNKGQDVELTESISGYLIRSDDDTVLVVGASSGNRAWIDLPASAYVKTGPIHIVIKAGETTIGACTGYVRRSTTDTIVDPGHIVPSIAELLAQIETMHQLSQTVTQQESGRVTAESGRVTAESARASAESARATAEANRGNAETGRTNAETARVNAENARANAETARVNAETARAAAETARENAETARGAAETSRANAESARDNAETVRANAETARGAAETVRANAETARAAAESARVSAETQRESDFATAKAATEAATTSANTAASKINNMTVAASGLPAGSTPTVAISEVDGHKHIVFGLVKGDPGKDFEIRKTFASIAQMQAYDPGTDPSDRKVRENDFVMIDTGSVQDVDTGKLFCYEPDTIDVWRYIGDLSGSQGIKGETGTGIANITLNQDYTLTIEMDDGTTSYTTGPIRGAQGPQGAQGDPGADGSDGADGVDGTSAYLYIRYSHTQPTQDSDMGTTPDDWMGIYSGTSSTPPTAYTDYAWYKIKGETGSVQNVYATTIPMSNQDNTKISEAIAGKTDKVANPTTGNFAGLDANGNIVDSGHAHGDYVAANEKGTANGIATLNASGQIPASQLPSFVDDIVNGYLYSGSFYKEDTHETLITPEDDKIYVDLASDLTYRWSGLAYVRVNETDVSGKADKVAGATANNFAGLDANGNLKDSGKKASDFVAANQGAGNVGKALGIDNTGAVVPIDDISRIKSGKEEDAIYHLGFYLDENGDLCQVESDEEEGA